MARNATSASATTPLVQPRQKSPTNPANSLPEPSAEEIRLRAFQIYQRRGSVPGRDAEDWEAARLELVEERTATVRQA